MAQLLNQDVLDSLARIDPSLLNRVLRIYLREAPTQLAAIRSAYLAADVSAASQAAHTLKGSSLAVGAYDVGDRCEFIERLGRLPTSREMTALADALQRTRAAITEEARARHARKPSM